MRCNDCNKFVSLEFSDPEVDQIKVNEGTVTATVRIVRTCADCGTELKEATLEMEADFEPPKPEDAKGEDKEHDLEVDEQGIDQIEEGGGRYAKSYFGAELSFKVTCSCGCDFTYEGTMSDKVAASEMDELT